MAFTQPQLQRIQARTLHLHAIAIRCLSGGAGHRTVSRHPAAGVGLVLYGAHGPIFGPNAAPVVSAALAHLSANRQAE